jgi:hypothetical protein
MPNFKVTTIPVIGNGKALGLTNGTNEAGLIGINDGYLQAYKDVSGDPVQVGGTDPLSSPLAASIVGVSKKASKSGIIADISDLQKDSLYWCIQVFNAATALSEQESAQLASQMQAKAQIDLSNVNENIDFVIESWSNKSGSWYKKYRSGWVEQGSKHSCSSTEWEQITLFVEMRDTNYSATATNMGTSDSSIYDVKVGSSNINTTTALSVKCSNAAGALTWVVRGYAATE